MAGRARDHFAEQFPVLEPTKRPAVIFQPRCLFIRSSHVSHERNHKSECEFFFRKGEEVAIKRHRSRVPVEKDKHTRVFEFKKHLTELLGLKEQALQFGMSGFSLKLFRRAKSSTGKYENFSIVTDGQWQLGLPNLISDEGSSELNGKS